MRLGAGKAARFNVSTQSTGGFDRLLPHTERDLLLPETPKGTILTHNDPESGSRLNQNVAELAHVDSASERPITTECFIESSLANLLQYTVMPGLVRGRSPIMSALLVGDFSVLRRS